MSPSMNLMFVSCFSRGVMFSVPWQFHPSTCQNPWPVTASAIDKSKSVFHRSSNHLYNLATVYMSSSESSDESDMMRFGRSIRAKSWKRWSLDRPAGACRTGPGRLEASSCWGCFSNTSCRRWELEWGRKWHPARWTTSMSQIDLCSHRCHSCIAIRHDMCNLKVSPRCAFVHVCFMVYILKLPMRCMTWLLNTNMTSVHSWCMACLSYKCNEWHDSWDRYKSSW